MGFKHIMDHLLGKSGNKAMVGGWVSGGLLVFHWFPAGAEAYRHYNQLAN